MVTVEMRPELCRALSGLCRLTTVGLSGLCRDSVGTLSGFSVGLSNRGSRALPKWPQLGTRAIVHRKVRASLNCALGLRSEGPILQSAESRKPDAVSRFHGSLP